MAYRRIERERPIKRVLQDMTTKNLTLIQNGATAYLAIPCWYQEIRHPQHTHVHDREWHDHVGWPTPDEPDRSSQASYAIAKNLYAYQYDYDNEGWTHPARYLDLSKMHPIHLIEEGYDKDGVKISFVDAPEGLEARGWIDEKDDWVVRFMINPMCEAALTEDVDVSYTVFVTGNGRRDIAAKGTLRILAGPYN